MCGTLPERGHLNAHNTISIVLNDWFCFADRQEAFCLAAIRRYKRHSPNGPTAARTHLSATLCAIGNIRQTIKALRSLAGVVLLRFHEVLMVMVVEGTKLQARFTCSAFQISTDV